MHNFMYSHALSVRKSKIVQNDTCFTTLRSPPPQIMHAYHIILIIYVCMHINLYFDRIRKFRIHI